MQHTDNVTRVSPLTPNDPFSSNTITEISCFSLTPHHSAHCAFDQGYSVTVGRVRTPCKTPAAHYWGIEWLLVVSFRKKKEKAKANTKHVIFTRNIFASAVFF